MLYKTFCYCFSNKNNFDYKLTLPNSLLLFTECCSIYDFFKDTKYILFKFPF